MKLSKKNQRDKEWLDPNSFKALQTVVLDEKFDKIFLHWKFGSLSFLVE